MSDQVPCKKCGRIGALDDDFFEYQREIISELQAENDRLKIQADRYQKLKAVATSIQWEGHHIVPITMRCLDASLDATKVQS